MVLAILKLPPLKQLLYRIQVTLEVVIRLTDMFHKRLSLIVMPIDQIPIAQQRIAIPITRM